jgi:nicotinate-nucleotide pyrophosphorylase (carboxylating)
MIMESFTIFDYIKSEDMNELLNYVFKEDFREKGDITSDAVFEDDKINNASILAKQDGIVAGLALIKAILHKISNKITVECLKEDGMTVTYGEKIMRINANMSFLLKVERICLNFLGRISGVATITHKFVEETRGTKCKILDTRKTTPGLRFAEKYAVRVGGGTNHRMGLYDVVLIKDNHIDGNGSLSQCVEAVRKKYENKYKIITETRTLNEVKEALAMNVDRILLDNMDVETTKKAIHIVNNKIPLESSGNITLDKVKTFAQLGVDYISTSYITAWAQPIDLSMVIELE